MGARTAVAAAAIWAIGTWLRLHGLNAMEFKADERISLELAIRLLEDHPWSSWKSWPTHGLISSNGVGNAPLFTWIVAPLWAATHHPIGVTVVIAVINALCLIPLWLWARRRTDESRALLTLAIASVSPFMVLWSRKIWPVDLLFPSLLAILWSIEWLRDGRHWRAIALGGFGVLLIMQLHQSGLITGPLLLIACGIQWAVDVRRGVIRRIARPTASEIVAIGLMFAATAFLWWTYLPYLRTIPADVLAVRPREPDFTPRLLWHVFSEIVPRNIRIPFYMEHDLFTADPVRRAVYSVSLALGMPLAVYGIWRWLRAPLTLPVIGIWWWLIVAAFAAARIPTHDYYVLAVVPLPILLAAGAFDGSLPRWLEQVLWRWRWTYVATLLVLTVLTGSWLAQRGGSRGDYGVVFEIQEAQGRALVSRFRNGAASSGGRAQVSPNEDASLECHPVSGELIWLAHWFGVPSSADLKRFEICHNWVSRERDVMYRWAIP